MDYRILQKDEVTRLAPVLDALGWKILYPEASTILVAEENGEIAGFCVQQTVVHLEPLWVSERHRGTGLAEGLVRRAARMLEAAEVRGWVSVAVTRHSEILCESIGMKPVEGKIYVRG